uniref:dual-specificity kinase n=1 Tax=Lutzomyia longipalpis TaxID=7200 RepID=A0A7G3AGM5_LUTLO
MSVSQHSGPGPPFKRGLSDRSVTGSSCRALKTAVSALYSVDDFIKEKIGSGFFSEVYKVTHRTTGQVMVLKMNQLRSNRPNMLREVQLLNKLSHPNILSFMGVCVQEGQLHALTEYINGGSLEQLIQSQGDNLSPCVKIKLALGISRGMQYVHDAGIFHRDLTSKNVLIRRSPDGQLDAVVGDFGLAAKIPRKKCGKNRLDTVGSPYWMSPECLNGLWYDQTSDVFSYGIILCELIASIEADPDVLPRTDSFGLDYLAFVDLCPADTPPAFLRLAFYCCTYDPKSRPTFMEIVKKMTILLDKVTDEDSILHIVTSPLSGVTAEDKGGSNGIASSNGIESGKGGANSLDAQLHSRTTDANEEEEGLVRMRNKSELKDHAALQHRRSMSENVIVFPQHTTPSDKARCHMLNRQIREPDSPTPDSPTYSNVTLRKVAETMFLKDPQYKPRVGENTKLNPFTALAQLRGVKKILGANPSSYTAGVGDLFSSCFEMSSPLVKEEWTPFDKNCPNGEITPKSLPNSPISGRKEYNCSNKMDRIATADGGNSKTTRKKQDGEENKKVVLELDLPKCTGTIKKFKANSLFSHPLFKSGQNDREDQTGNASQNEPSNECAKEMIEKSKSDSSETVCYENSKVLNRRGSTESGFFSCLNEDFCGGASSASYKASCCCFDGINVEQTDRIPLCPCCFYGAPYQTPKKDDMELSNPTLSDTNGILRIEDTSTPVSSLRSLDDLELSDSRKQRFYCRHHMIGNNVDIDTRSIDMGFINRLALDSEINSLIQKSQFANQLLYCKNRTSSIYTDSSDDISSLAGSDSLLWDDRSYTSIPNTRSAQIAKIVEYFERKGQAFKQFSVPESLKTTPSMQFTQAQQPARFATESATSSLTGCFSDIRRDYGLERCYVDYNSRNADYEAFCMELEKKPTQQRLTVCEGAVRSKLQLFDKVKHNASISGTGNGNSGGGQTD